MHDPKFEKEVQQKMAELEFSPSESVWANVEKELKRPQTRRSFPFFWRLALPALLLLAGGGYYFLRSKPAVVSPVAANTTPATATPPVASTSITPAPTASSSATSALTPAPAAAASSNSAKPGAGESATLAAAPDNTTTATRNTTSTRATTSTHTTTHTAHPAGASTSEGNAVSSTLTAAGTGTRPTHSRDPFAAASNTHRNRTKGQTSDQSAPTIQSADLATASESGTGSTTEPATKSGLVGATTGSAITNNSTATPGNTTTSDATRQPFLFNPVLANLNTSAAAVHASKLATKNTIAIKTLQSPHRPWEAAFAGGAGVSSLHQVQISNVTLNNAVSSFSSRDSASSNVTYNAARPSKQYISTVKPGVSFWAGVLAHKPLSDRWGLSLGLNLSYYSTRVRVGEQVSSYTPSSASLLVSSAVAPIQSYPYYNTGNEQAYTNRYYFLELPVAAEWRINRSRLLPLFWNGGFSLSYLMGSSAVYYNTKSGVYFKDGGVANHTQVNISTALMVGLPVRGLRVQLGPQVQYGLRPLLNTELSGSQHIFYGGLRLVVYPGKK